MDFTKEFIETNKLDDGQMTAINKAVNDNEAILEKGWEGKANENAEGIISGAGKKQIEVTGIQRNQGEKWADYLTRSTDGYLAGSKASLERSQKELDEKIKNAGTDEVLKSELISAKQKIEGLQKIEAEHSEWVKGDFKNLLEKSSGELSNMKEQIAFSNTKPKFADGVNEYEATAKWNSFTSNILEKYEIRLDEQNVPHYFDKENEFKKGKLSDLVKEDQEIQELVKGRQQTGTGASTKNNVEIKGIPFKVPENATPKERQKAIRDYITGELKLAPLSQGYADKYSEYNSLLLEKKPA